jgi:hypothetical protein
VEGGGAKLEITIHLPLGLYLSILPPAHLSTIAHTLISCNYEDVQILVEKSSTSCILPVAGEGDLETSNGQERMGKNRLELSAFILDAVK